MKKSISPQPEIKNMQNQGFLQKNFFLNNFPGILTAAVLHLVVLQFIIFCFPEQRSPKTLQITFLGAILEPFEAGRTKPYASMAKGDSFLINTPHQKTLKDFTATQKPNMSGHIKPRAKTTQKTLLETKQKSLPASTIDQPGLTETLPKYQPLKLYNP